LGYLGHAIGEAAIGTLAPVIRPQPGTGGRRVEDQRPDRDRRKDCAVVIGLGAIVAAVIVVAIIVSRLRD
jgi:hypothetical protein